MILLFTDFGSTGPYLGQMEAVLRIHAPGVDVIDLVNNAPSGEPRLAAYLLAALAKNFPAGSIFLCVVDPGVGGERLPVALEADGRWFVGPDNGLLNTVAIHAASIIGSGGSKATQNSLAPRGERSEKPLAPEGRGVGERGLTVLQDGSGLNSTTLRAGVRASKSRFTSAAIYKWRIIAWQPKHLSASFHGRDLFAPVAASIARGDFSWSGGDWVGPKIDGWPDDIASIVYFDHYGNAITGWRYSEALENKLLLVNGLKIPMARTFSGVPAGMPFWYCNSMGLVEIAVNLGRADETLALSLGQDFHFKEFQ